MQLSKLTRHLVTILLLSSVLTVELIPNAISQQFTTSTSFLTSTQTETNTSYYQTSQTIMASSSVGTLSTTEYLTSVGAFQTTTNPYFVCYSTNLYTISFNSIGASIHLHFSASQPVTVFIVNQADINAANANDEAGGFCLGISMSNLNPSHFASPSGGGLSSGDFPYLTLPASGNPYFLLITSLSSSNINVTPTVSITIGPVSVPSSSTSISTVSIQLALTRTDTLTTATTLEIPFTQTYGNWIVATIVGVLVAIVLFVVVMRKRRTTPTQQETVQPATKPKPENASPEKQFCIECGSGLPLGSKFCGKCGAKQT